MTLVDSAKSGSASCGVMSVSELEMLLALSQAIPEIERVEILPKRGRLKNEMTSFRYDVVLRVAGGEGQRTSDQLEVGSGKWEVRSGSSLISSLFSLKSRTVSRTDPSASQANNARS